MTTRKEQLEKISGDLERIRVCIVDALIDINSDTPKSPVGNVENLILSAGRLTTAAFSLISIWSLEFVERESRDVTKRVGG